MGTSESERQQWIELYNPNRHPIDLEGWTLSSANRAFSIPLTGTLASRGSLIIAQTSHRNLPGINVHLTFPGTLSPAGEHLQLIDPEGNLVDQVDAWHAGNPRTFATMQRVFPYQDGTLPESWDTSTVRYDLGFGTPGFRDTTRQTGQDLHYVYHGPGAMNVYFNRSALTEYARRGNEANHNTNIEERLLDRIRNATNRIDITIYEINLPDLANLLIQKAAEGIQVRVIADSKEPTDIERIERDEIMRLMLERMRRGADGILGTEDDIPMIANSPIFAVEDPVLRRTMGLRARITAIPRVDLQVGNRRKAGRLLVRGEQKPDASYYAPGAQMHNKFVVIDDQWVFTTSMNFTLTDLYGDESNRVARALLGNANNAVEINSPEVAQIFLDEFNQMWGDTGPQPNYIEARFSGRKARGREPHRVQVGNRAIDIYFSPGYNVVQAITRFVEEQAREKLYFAIFAWSDYDLERAVKMKWETYDGYREGARTDFILRGVFEFWDEWWSAGRNMAGRRSFQQSETNPNIRWKYRPPVFASRGVRRLHHKYMIIDADTRHNPTVITGSANWSNNANNINDENTLFIYCPLIANQFTQEFYARYKDSGGTLD